MFLFLLVYIELLLYTIRADIYKTYTGYMKKIFHYLFFFRFYIRSLIFFSFMFLSFCFLLYIKLKRRLRDAHRKGEGPHAARQDLEKFQDQVAASAAEGCSNKKRK